MHNPHSENRRRFLLSVAVGAVVPLAGLRGRAVNAAEKRKLDPDSERARQLGYTHDATSTDNGARKDGARCANCTHFKGESGAQWAPCNIFPDSRVNADGWCASWYGAG